MKKTHIKKYEEFTNEELNIKKAITGAALGAGLAFGTPAKAQTTNTITPIGMEQTQKNLTADEKFDILRNELIKMKNDQTEVKLNLYKCHQEFKVGVGMLGTGIGLGILGRAIIINDIVNMKQDQYHRGIDGKTVAIIGGVLSLAGSIVMIDSHKFIARASLTGIKVNFGGDGSKKPEYKTIKEGDYFLYMGPGAK